MLLSQYLRITWEYYESMSIVVQKWVKTEWEQRSIILELIFVPLLLLLGIKLRTDSISLATASVLYHRFFRDFSTQDFDQHVCPLLLDLIDFFTWGAFHAKSTQSPNMTDSDFSEIWCVGLLPWKILFPKFWIFWTNTVQITGRGSLSETVQPDWVKHSYLSLYGT